MAPTTNDSPAKTKRKGKNSPTKKMSYKAKRRSNKALRRISDSSFNHNLLSESKISSTPLRGKKGKKLKSVTPRSGKKRKGNPSGGERSSKRRRGEAAGPSPVNVVASPILEQQATPRIPKATQRKVSRLPTARQVKNVENLQVLFRNDFVLPAAVDEKKHERSPECRATVGDDSVIVLDDDDDVDDDVQCESEKTMEPTNQTVVETVGQELMDLAAADNAVPDTPKTLLKKWNFTSADRLDQDDDTIVLDDSQDDEEVATRSDSPDSVIVLEEREEGELTASVAEGTNESVQEIAAKYFTTDASLDFIPLNSKPAQPDTRNSDERSSRRGRRNNPRKEANQRHNFQPVLPPDFNFIGGGGGNQGNQVYRFQGGSREEAPVPAIYSDDSLRAEGPRPIVVDGSNIAFAHGKSNFSVKGIQMVVNWFQERGHEQVVAFLPQFRVREAFDTLNKMETEGTVIFTPSRNIGTGKRICSYDDRFILDFAVEKNAIVVSRDNYRDLYQENARYKETIEKRILMPTFIGDTLMFPQDPLGRDGPRLDEFLRF